MHTNIDETSVFVRLFIFIHIFINDEIHDDPFLLCRLKVQAETFLDDQYQDADNTSSSICKCVSYIPG